MIIINYSESPAKAWKEVSKKLLAEGQEDVDAGFFRHSAALLEIENINVGLYDSDFPMSQSDISIINNYLVTGEREQEVIHEWTKIYRDRLFNSNQNQIESIIEYLKAQPAGKRAQASIWTTSDINAQIAPCLQILWFQIKFNRLEMHVHMRAVDCYGKLLMNINEFAALQQHIAATLHVEIGHYIHFIDSLHFNLDDKEKVLTLFS